ncbi:MAG: alpha/beta fold hydrolase [Clostridia bacterium]|nr:alpha/beta fold hydrolase [Clostridia bacterium]
MELLRIKVFLTGYEKVEGFADTAVMLPFTGKCESALFHGDILSGGVDTQRITPDGKCRLSARYMLEGTDCEGEKCRLFIQNEGVSLPGQPMVTYPVFRTDSRAIKWLETAALTGALEHYEDHIEIVLSGGMSDRVERIALQRAGLTLRGLLEKPENAGNKENKKPLVMMMHGFCACMDDGNGGLLQQLSDRLTAEGVMTLRFDFNGHGNSEGSFREMTPLNELEDAAAFLQYALSRDDVSEVYLLGHSQGGVIAGMLAGCYHDKVKKLVMLNPAASLKTDAIQGTIMGTEYDPVNIPDAVKLFHGADLGGLYFRIAQMLPLHEMTARFTGPAMAVIGGRDFVVKPQDIRRYGELMPNCCITEYATLDHGLGGEERDAALTAVIDFLK